MVLVKVLGWTSLYMVVEVADSLVEEDPHRQRILRQNRIDLVRLEVAREWVVEEEEKEEAFAPADF